MRALPRKLKRGFNRLLGRKAAGQKSDSSPKASASPELRARAAEGIREYAEENESLFERASRFEERAERLRAGEGSTSESALMRAERARAEIRAGLLALRESFAASNGEEGRLAFDAELEALHPRLGAVEG